MVRGIILSVVLFGTIASGQAVPATQPLSPEEAMQRLKARQAQRDAARQQPVTITRGELDDLRAEVAALKAEIAKLKGEPAPAPVANAGPAPAEPRFVSRITAGTTRAQLITFIAMRKDRYCIARDVREPDKQELMTVEKFYTADVKAGTTTNGVNTIRLTKKEKFVEKACEIILLNDVITSIDGADGEID